MNLNTIKFLTCAVFCSMPAAGAWANGAVYAMTNALENNEVKVYFRDANGNLSLVQTAATGGGGSGLQLAGVDSLGSVGSVQVDPSRRLLFVVNTENAAENNGAGTYNTDCQQGTITSFRIASDGSSTFADRVFSGGLFPNSLTVTKPNQDSNGQGQGSNGQGQDQGGEGSTELLYVLNAGGPEPPAVCNLTPDTAYTPNITGFEVDSAGHMIPLDSTQPGPGVRAQRRQLHRRRSHRILGVNGCSPGGFRVRLKPAILSALAGSDQVHARWRSAGRDGQGDQYDLCFSD